MAVRKFFTLDDFRAGVTLPIDQWTEVSAQPKGNELLTGEGIELLRSGGITRRGGRVSTTLNQAVTTIDSPMALKTFSLNQFLAAAANGSIYYSTPLGTSWTAIGLTNTSSLYDKTRGVQFNDNLYILNGQEDAIRWNGTTATRLAAAATGYNDDLTAPVGGKFVRGGIATVHQGSMWCVSVTEYPTRLRWSHPNEVEDWRTDDYIDIDRGLDGDDITALVSLQDALLVFKSSAVYAVLGYDSDTYQVVRLLDGVGCKAQSRNYGGLAVAADDVVYFDSGERGIFSVTRSGKLTDINPRYPIDSTIYGMACVDGRLFVSSLGEGLWIYDTQERGWVVYEASSYRKLMSTHDDRLIAAASPTFGFSGGRFLHYVDYASVPDTLPLDTERAIVSTISTSWLDLGQPNTKKRWKAPKVHFTSSGVVGEDTTEAVSVVATAYVDWSNTPLWQVEVGQPDQGISFLEGLSGFGSARSVRLQLQVTSFYNTWTLNSITFPYIPRPTR